MKRSELVEKLVYVREEMMGNVDALQKCDKTQDSEQYDLLLGRAANFASVMSALIDDLRSRV